MPKNYQIYTSLNRFISTLDVAGKFLLMIVAGLIFSIFFKIICYLNGSDFPWGSFLYVPSERFADWFNAVVTSTYPAPYFSGGNAIPTYFPLTYLLLYPFGHLSKLYSSTLYVTISCFILAIGVYTNILCLKELNIAKKYSAAFKFMKIITALFISYPVMYAIDRGNLDIWISGLCLIFAGTFFTTYTLFGFFALSIAISMKGYPAAFLLLGFRHKRYYSIIFCLILVLFFCVGSLMLMDKGYSYNLAGFLESLSKYYDLYVYDSASLFASSDPYNAIRSFAIYLGRNNIGFIEWSRNILKYYHLFSFAFLLISSIYVIFISEVLWKQLITIGLICLVFPNVSNDYKLSILIPGIVAFLCKSKNEDCDRESRYLIVFSLIFIPKSFYFIKGIGGYSYYIGITNVLNAVLLMYLWWLIVGDVKLWKELPTHIADQSRHFKSKLVMTIKSKS